MSMTTGDDDTSEKQWQMGASNSNYPPPSNYSSAPQIGSSEDPSLSIVSIDDTFFSVDDPPEQKNQVKGGDGTGEDIIVVKPIVSDKPSRAKGDQSTYTSGSAFSKLDSSNRRQKKKKCGCACCQKRNSKMNGIASYDSFEEPYGPAEIFTVQSAEDMIVSPANVIPLSMVASLDMTPSQVATRPKKTRRTTIPEKPDKPMSLWGLIKSAIGKDITKFPLPVNFSEPLSMLQRLAEEFEYSSILDKASNMTDSLEQLAAVSAFTVSSYATCAYRTAKPFNPLLGETFEFDRTDDRGWRLIAEQVCHHPPIASLHCESARGWVHWQQFTMKSNFRATYLEIHPLGIAHLRFKRDDNHYTWRKVSTIVRNLYMGKLYIEQEGEMDILNHTTFEKCHMKYSCGGMFSRDRTVSGRVYTRTNEPKLEIRGSWDSEVTVTRLDASGQPMEETTKILWRRNTLPADAEKRYSFSQFACQLNEMEEGVAPTDSRNRPDQRYMENGQWDEANIEKVRLEEKQRESRKTRLTEGAANYSTSSKLNTKSVRSSNAAPTAPDDGVEPYYTPCWFTRQRDPLSGQYIYMYNGDYWNCKETHNWTRSPKIYDK